MLVVPPFVPAQDQAHGPAPLMAEAVPVLQRPVVGAVEDVTLFEAPHAPLTGAGGALHCAVVPPFVPAQDHAHGPVPLMAEAVPVLQRPVVGADVELTLFEAPHAPLTAATTLTGTLMV